jgi:Predicted integral membrane protein (DUF2269)
MPGWFVFWLTLHILLVIVAFGPTFAFGIITGLASKEPMHMPFVLRYIETVSERMTIPLAVVIPVTGVGLIFSAPGEINLWKSEWLIIALILYTAAFFYSLLVQLPIERRLLKLISNMPPGPPPTGGPPPEIAAMAKRLQMGGIFLSLMIVTILILMVWRPGNCQGLC